MAGMHFQFKIDQRVVCLYDGAIVKITTRKIELIGKTYLIKYKSGRLGGYVSESDLRALKEGDE